MDVELGDLDSADVRDLLSEHLAGMRANSPPGSVFALDLSGLKAKPVTFWTIREGTELLGCGALKELDSKAGEIKSMRTAKHHLRKGVANLLLTFILDEARRRQYERLYLETGSSDAFIPAILLYKRFGFTRCGAFSGYKENDFSVFMKLEL